MALLLVFHVSYGGAGEVHCLTLISVLKYSRRGGAGGVGKRPRLPTSHGTDAPGQRNTHTHTGKP